MRRFLIILILLTLLTGCRYQEFDYGTTIIDTSSDYDLLLKRIIEEGKYEDNVVGPYSRFRFFVDYRNGSTMVEGLNVSTYRDYDGKETTYDSTDCFAEEGILSCREHKSSVEGFRILPEIEFRYAFEQFSNVDVALLVYEVKSHYDIGYTEKTFLYYKFALPEDIEPDNDSFEDVLCYYDEQYHYDDVCESPDMMLEIALYFQDNEGGFAYKIYWEIDE